MCYLSNQFIQRNNKYCTFDKHVSAPYFRKVFVVKNPPKSAILTVCGLGFYELYLNGKNITKGLLAPYISNPDDVLYYDYYDITTLLNSGENVIGIVLGNGFLNNIGGNVWDFDKAGFRDAPKVALAVEIDGAIVVETDETFKTAESPIIFDDLRAGEHFDARKEQKGWNKVSFNDSAWDYAVCAVEPKGEKRVCRCETIIVRAEYKPVSITKVEGGYLYSFPVNSAGVPRLTISGYQGQEVILTCGEVLKNGKLDMKKLSFEVTPWRKEGSREGYVQCDRYICSGEGKETYTPRFTYHGFQYVYVQGITEEQATPELLTYLEISSNIKQAGTFTCSSDVVNSIQDCTVRSTISNFVYFPTDCPHREKNGWTGDAQLCAEETMFNFHAENSWKEWLANIRKAQKEDGAIPGVIPTTGFGYEFGSGPAWDNVLIQLPYYAYKYSGDRDIIIENLDTIIKYIRYMIKKADSDGIIEYGLGDWCQVGKGESFDTSVKITDTLYMMEACYKTIRMCVAVHNEEAIDELNGYYNYLRDSFRTAFVVDGKIKDEYATQTAVAMALYYKAFNKEEEDKAFEQLLNLIYDNGGFMKVGVLGARVLFRVLSDFGYAELAYELITRKEFPSYGYMIECGTTTLWEVLDGSQSLNHFFWGDVSAWFYKYIAGIRINPKLEEKNLVEIKPCYISKLDYCKATRDVEGGKLTVEWRRDGADIQLRIIAPSNIKVVAKNAIINYNT